MKCISCFLLLGIAFLASAIYSDSPYILDLTLFSIGLPLSYCNNTNISLSGAYLEFYGLEASIHT